MPTPSARSPLRWTGSPRAAPPWWSPTTCPPPTVPTGWCGSPAAARSPPQWHPSVSTGTSAPASTRMPPASTGRSAPMLPGAEQSLVDRDPDLPGLALLLDRDRLTRWLGSLLGRPVTVRLHHLRYKPGTSCVLHVQAGDQALLVAATARSEAAKHAKTLERSAGSVIGTDPGRQVLGGTPAADRDLPGVALLTDPAQRDRLLGRLLRHGPVVDPAVEPVLLRYKPHRRWVGLLPAITGEHVLLRVQPP